MSQLSGDAGRGATSGGANKSAPNAGGEGEKQSSRQNLETGVSSSSSSGSGSGSRSSSSSSSSGSIGHSAGAVGDAKGGGSTTVAAAAGSKTSGATRSQQRSPTSGSTAAFDNSHKNKIKNNKNEPITVAETKVASGNPVTGKGANIGAGSKSPAAGGNTSSTQRLSSIEILNENRQRQLQFKQQESFRQHLEQRQRLIQEQQQKQQTLNRQQQRQQQYQHQDSGARNQEAAIQEDYSIEPSLGVTYQVNTCVPDYMAQAVASSAAASKQAATTTTINSNPFNSIAPKAGARSYGVKSDNEPSSATLSGKKGFLSALMDEASFEGAQNVDESSDELNSEVAAKAHLAAAGKLQVSEPRYARVAAGGTSSYNYDEDPSKMPFYKKDFATLLQDCRASRKLVILIVAIALLLDNMLLTSVVPIIPAYLYKLRIERQHRDLLLSGNDSSLLRQTATNNQPGRMQRPNQGNEERQLSQLSEEELEAELQRRINQSMAAVKDRFSGSVFHPQVHFKPMRQPKEEENGDDDDDDDGDERDRSKLALDQNSRQSARDDYVDAASDDEDVDDDDIGKDGADDAGSSKAGASSRDDGDGEPKPGKGAQRKWQGARKGTSAGGRLRVAAKQRENAATSDDEDEANAQRWLKLKSSLVSMVRKSGNDSDALGGMCLSMVMNEADEDDDGEEEQEDGDELQQGVKVTSGRQQRKQKRPTEQKGARRVEREARIERPKPRVLRPTGRPQAPVTTSRPEVADESSASNRDQLQEEKHNDDGELIISHQDIVDESFEVGVMFASKPIVQAIANPFIGTLTNRVGFTIPMFTGFVIMFLSTLVFAFGSTYSTLFVARAIQGVGSACTSVAGMSMLADRFPEDAERGNAMAIALGGLALGVVIGPPFGGFMYEFVGKASPFIVLAVLALLDGLLQLMVLQPRVTKNQDEGASLMTLIKDPYILVAAGAITFANTGIAILEPALPLWMMDTMQAKNWEQGVAFLPAALSYLFGTNLFGNLGHKIGRWRSTMIGLVIIGCSLLLIPFATRVDHLIIPNGAIGFAMGMVDSTMMPMLGYLVDIRHTSVYGSVYAIGDVAFCASFAFGPALSGTLVELIGFEGLIITTAMICFCFAPLLLLLRNPPARQVNEAQLLEQSTLRYVNYSHLDSPDEEAQLTAGNYKSGAKTYVR